MSTPELDVLDDVDDEFNIPEGPPVRVNLKTFRSSLPPSPYLISNNTLFGMAGLALAFGFGVGLKVSWKGKAPPGAVWTVAKAFIAGTLLCATGASVMAYGTSRYLGVSNFREFADYMKATVPDKADKIRGVMYHPKETPPTEGHAITTSAT